ncbi:MAG: ATP-binding protein [Bacteroidota bacterium]
MKLLTKTALVYIAATLLLFFAGGVIFYFQLKRLADEEVTETLRSDKKKITEYYLLHGSLPNNHVLFSGKIDTTRVVPAAEYIHDTMIYDQGEEEFLEYKVLAFSMKNRNTSFNVLLSVPSFESEDLINTIGYTLLAIAAVLVVMLLVINGVFSLRLWKPFFNTLNEIKKLDLNERDTLDLPDVKTKEFRMLNEEIREMAKKAKMNYIQLRAFTENASHELQTPLASLLLDSERLLQNENISEDMALSVHRMYNTVLRLSKINEVLLLLAKINNDQFPKSSVDIGSIVKEKLAFYKERILFKKLDVNIDIRESLHILMSPELADIFIENLLSNAIRHNIENGSIRINISLHEIAISNSGVPLLVNPETLFERFRKNDQSSSSSGLGLAIVKQIADLYKFSAKYSYSEMEHRVIVML